MAKNKHAFAIDDTSSTSDNLAEFAKLLESMDAPLGAALSPFLASLAAGQPLDPAAVWDALDAATAPADPPPDQPGEEAAGTEEAP